ncbi:nucleotide sugar dehydrogenase [Didymella exigua CBS 183.55]|uniref:Nucleotide sugar dehydrogenase n=1 Tax=Didymella exigua CBS 183.55 TaxID=1150837 RepID=A0A6A5REJ0_9PLEO|nr:nucleotide sugar dehydrogenase [Didymella exigua CBS 183.55]KAF1925618.1 nucleotide sugar dehydrogenase [Didymella exigua CBS 183.55]
MTTTTLNSKEAKTIPADTSRLLRNVDTIGVIGVGYVGKHLLDVFSSSFKVIGYDVSSARVKALRCTYSQGSHVQISNNEQDLKAAKHFLISVPTTLGLDENPDLSHIISATKIVERYAGPGSVVVIESTVAVGTTRLLLEPIARSLHLFAGMSPERIDPGRVLPPARSIPKVVSGLDDVVPGSLKAITLLYDAVFDTVIPVSKPEVAEMLKLYENCQRTVAIAYANEMADACIPYGIDPFEVAKVASSKPFGYLPVYPSLGIGGHCIPVNPAYLLSTCDLPILQQAYEETKTRPSRIASRLLVSLLKDEREAQRASSQPRLLVVGLGFKAGQSDLSNSPGLQLLNFMRDSGAVDLTFCDPLVDQSAVPEVPKLKDSNWKQAKLRSFNAIVVAIKQPGLDYSVLEGIEGPKVYIWQY